jgi:NAD(P)-dependent dehydrogenase (short-subunit alcohol dehydrogenase family)
MRSRSVRTMPRSDRFAGKVAIVTGGASGIGLATVERIAGEGGRVAIFDAVEDGLANVPERLRDGDAVCAHRVDVSDAAQVQAAVEAVHARWSRIDVLVNSAGALRWGGTTDTVEADWDLVMSVNLKGAWLVSRAVVPFMTAACGGSIVHVASNMGVRGVANQLAYSASKGGVIALTRSMAVDLGPSGIRVNCVNPGHVSTPMGDSAAERLGLTEETVAVKYPIGRIGVPAEQAAAIAFLAADEAAFVTGAIVAVDGGYTA